MTKKSVMKGIERWQEHHSSYQANDFEVLYDHWIRDSFDQINPDVKQKFFSRLDGWLFHTHAFLQGSAFQNDARERILTVGRIFQSEVTYVEDMRQLDVNQLTYIADQQVARGRLYSFAQGGLTGTGGWLLLGVDFPLMTILNLRAVQLIGLTFGHEMNHPYEMMISFKVFHAAMLPKRLQLAAWDDLIEEIRNNDHPYVYEGNDQITDETWLEQPLKQSFKSLFILMFRRKLFQGIPLVSVAIGAYSNYQLTKQMTEFAMKFYQYRHLMMEQEG
ncbi:EcsC family protein [Halobacillus shinanisalinarum]|uniref:EcsC family protein n=1 Tax=Halobacillus shinanisalinarum TaxID=2932258 RepID=A0ABY4H114_9BACI|nr:EcsC family protein [Halobacillus shinanisalinarum]UOQ94136.1 EcsC family protein [Halobacillus shinanisalinarum]